MSRSTMAAGRLDWLIVVGVAVLLWLPRAAGPIDLRYDGGVYYILGTSLAQGLGYRLLNEPGEIADVQYPPLLPAIVAAHQLILGTSDPTTVGRWLRLSSFLTFIAYALLVLRFLRSWLRPREAVLGSMIPLLCMYSWFLSDLLFPEILFTLATLLFLMLAGKEGSRTRAGLAYASAVASYALRTVGIVAFAAWVLDSLLRRRYKQALVRAVLVLIPVVAWQSYVASVERSDAYTQPAYEYQRAPYLFYNVSYARNIALHDPFTPEQGPARIVERTLGNARLIPVRMGETLFAPRDNYYRTLQALAGTGARAWRLIDWSVFTLLFCGGVLAGAGLLLQMVRRQWLPPLYTSLYMAAVCMAPFPDQYLRYLMPLSPVLALSALLFLGALGRAPRPGNEGRRRLTASFAVLGPAVLVSATATAVVYARQHQPVAYVDARGERVAYRLFFYSESDRGFDEAVDYVRAHARPTTVVAAGTPHWVYLRTGLKAVMPPFEIDVAKAQRLLDSVPVDYLIIGGDVVAAERYTSPVVQRFPEHWQQVFSTSGDLWRVYRRASR